MESEASDRSPAADPTRARPREAGREYRLFRVDDRLLHGQVALGWGRALRPSCFLLADDQLASEPDSVGLYQASAPEGTRVLVDRLEAVLRGETEEHDPGRTILLVRGVPQAARLLRGGVPGPLSLGGIHKRPGARGVLPYLFLTPEDEAILLALLADGTTIYAQDLPASPKQPADRWLACGGRPR